MPLQVEVVSPERILFSGDANLVLARTLDGDVAFMAGHTPFLGALDIGPLTIRLADGGSERAAVLGGYVEVNHDRVTVLSDAAEMAGDIDRGRAERARQEAEREADRDDAEAEARLRRARVRLDVAE